MFKPFNLYSPEDVAGKGVVDTGLPNPQDSQDVIDFLGDDKDEKEVIDLTPPKKEKEKEPEKKETKKETKEKKDEDEDEDDDEIELVDEDDDELKAIEEELEGPKDEQLELMVPARRREILKEYPDLFKKFPYLERAYYREQAFTEITPTIEDAKLAVEKANVLDNFEKELMTGSTEKIIRAIKEESPDGFNKLVDDYLPTLEKIDERAYHHVLGSVIKDTIVAMVEEAETSKNESLRTAAQLLNQFVFGTSKFEPQKPLSSDKPKENKNDDVNKEREAFLKEKLEMAQSDLNTKVQNILKATIDGNIDPKKSMSDYVRNKAAEDVQKTVERLLSQDTRFKTVLNKLWEAAAKDKYSKNSIDTIKSAILSRARTLLPAAIKTARNQALKGMGKRVKEETEEENNKEKESKPRSRDNSGDNKTGKVPTDHTKTTLELLMEE
jgi:hypothetical protein